MIGPMVFRYREARSSVLGYLRSTLRPPRPNAHKLDTINPSRKASSSRLNQQIAKLLPLAESTLPLPLKTYHDRWLGPHNNNRTLAELEMYEQATKNDWQDGGFRIRYSKEIPGLPLLKNTCWHCSYCQSNVSQIIQKLGASSHREYNTIKKRSRAWILDQARRGVDLLGRQRRMC